MAVGGRDLSADRCIGAVPNQMVEQTASKLVTVSNPQGLHARPAHAFVSLASEFKSDVQVIRNGQGVDGKSILSVLTLAAEQGTQLTLKATGNDAEQAVEALSALVLNDFGEAGEETVSQ